MQFVQRPQPFPQRSLPGGDFQFGLDLLMQALQFVPLPRQVSTFPGKGHFHLPDFGHELLFVAFELFPFPQQFLFECEEFLFAWNTAVGSGTFLGQLQFLVKLTDEFGLLLEESFVFLLTLPPAGRFTFHEIESFAGLVEQSTEATVFLFQSGQFRRRVFGRGVRQLVHQ